MRRFIYLYLAVMAAIFLGGCAVPYHHPVKTEQEMRRDLAECAAQGGQAGAAWGSIGFGRALDIQDLCMEARGYGRRGLIW